MIEDLKILKFWNCNQDGILKILAPQIFCCFQFEEVIIEFIPTEFFRFQKYRKCVLEISIFKKMYVIRILDLSHSLLILHFLLNIYVEFILIRCHD